MPEKSLGKYAMAKCDHEAVVRLFSNCVPESARNYPRVQLESAYSGQEEADTYLRLLEALPWHKSQLFERLEKFRDPGADLFHFLPDEVVLYYLPLFLTRVRSHNVDALFKEALNDWVENNIAFMRRHLSQAQFNWVMESYMAIS